MFIHTYQNNRDLFVNAPVMALASLVEAGGCQQVQGLLSELLVVAFNPKTQEAEGPLSYRRAWSRGSSRTARATQRNFVPKHNKTKITTTKK